MYLCRDSNKNKDGTYKQKVGFWILFTGLALVLAGCEKKDVLEDPYSETQLVKKINSWFANYDFRDKTPAALDQLDEFSAEGKSLVALEKSYLTARTYMDWLFTAIFQNDSDLLRGLFAKIDLDESCCPEKKVCIRSRRMEIDLICAKKLQKKLHKKFQELRHMEEEEGAYAQLAENAQTLLRSFLLERNNEVENYRSTVNRLSLTDDPVGNRASLLMLVEGASTLSSVSMSPPSRAGYLMSYLAHHWCEEPIDRIRPEMSDQEIRRILIPGKCGYMCEEIDFLPRHTVKTYKKVVEKCPAVFLGFDKQQEERIYFTQQSFLAFRALNMLVARAARLQRDKTDPLLKKHADLLLFLHRQLFEVRVALPYPPVMPVQKTLIEPPIVNTFESMEIYAPVHIAVDDTNYYVGIMPYGGVSRREARLLDIEKGYILPGKAQLIPKRIKGPLLSLQAMIKSARLSAARIRPPGWKAEKHSSWISIYADHSMDLKKIAPLLSELSKIPNPPVDAVQLIFVKNPVAGAASHGATLHLGQPPKHRLSLKIVSEEIVYSTTKKTEERDYAPIPLVIEEARGTIEELVRGIVRARRQHGPTPVYWEI